MESPKDLTQYIQEIVMKFRLANALSKSSAKSLEELHLDIKQSEEVYLSFNYMKHMRSARKYKGRYFFDEAAYQNPKKINTQRSALILSVIVLVSVIALATLWVLDKYGIIQLT